MSFVIGCDRWTGDLCQVAKICLSEYLGISRFQTRWYQCGMVNWVFSDRTLCVGQSTTTILACSDSINRLDLPVQVRSLRRRSLRRSCAFPLISISRYECVVSSTPTTIHDPEITLTLHESLGCHCPIRELCRGLCQPRCTEACHS